MKSFSLFKSRRLDNALHVGAIFTLSATARCSRRSKPAPNVHGSQLCAIGKTKQNKSVAKKRKLRLTGKLKTERYLDKL